MKQSIKFSFILTFFAIIVFSLSNCKGTDKTKTTETDTTKVVEHKETKPHWTYEGEEGPQAWAGICDDYKNCAGQAQSPVDITGAKKDANLKPLFLDYAPNTKLDISNNGHTVMVNYNTGSFVIDGKDYHLLQFHFHAPSEYTIKGEHFPAEAHLVHSDVDGNLAVIGLMIKIGKENTFFNTFWDKLPAEKSDVQTYNVNFDINNFLPTDKGYYSLMGSLTTPPCTEGVKWFVLKTPVEATQAQIDKLISTMPKNNNRPVQPLNGREIKEF